MEEKTFSDKFFEEYPSLDNESFLETMSNCDDDILKDIKEHTIDKQKIKGGYKIERVWESELKNDYDGIKKRMSKILMFD